jgi:hypothetical protein
MPIVLLLIARSPLVVLRPLVSVRVTSARTLSHLALNDCVRCEFPGVGVPHGLSAVVALRRSKVALQCWEEGQEQAACLHQTAALAASARPSHHARANRHSTNCAIDQPTKVLAGIISAPIPLLPRLLMTASRPGGRLGGGLFALFTWNREQHLALSLNPLFALLRLGSRCTRRFSALRLHTLPQRLH